MNGRDVTVFVFVIVAVVGFSIPLLSMLQGKPGGKQPHEAATTDKQGSEPPSVVADDSKRAPADRDASAPPEEQLTEISTEGESTPEEPTLPEFCLPIALPGETPQSMQGGYYVEGDKFFVRFPNKPDEVRSGSRKYNKGKPRSYQTWKGARGKLKWGLTAYDLESGGYMISEKSRKLRAARKHKDAVLHNCSVRLNDCWGWFLSIEKQDGSQVTRHAWYVADKRLYALTVSGPPDRVDSRTGNLMFLSFFIVSK